MLRLKKIDLREISLVTMPMNTEAKVTAVKTVTDGQILPSLPDFENFLREAGFSSHCSGVSPAVRTPPTSCRHSPHKFAAEPHSYGATHD